ncbi:hypothetical protein [Arthrobacter sp. I3]|uniref:hypothetical protein n=1 Tax=Arthrobacter sp. I3 TaxID=218158 RepID=UPI000484BA5F|nr:hypothetical protein [Arthrobacter sp. I3]
MSARLAGVNSGFADLESLPELLLQRLVVGFAAPAGTGAGVCSDEDSARVSIQTVPTVKHQAGEKTSPVRAT